MLKRLTLLLFLTTLWAGASLQAQTLIHYWNFNTSTSETTLLTPSSTLVTGAGIQHIKGSSSSTVETTSNTTGQGFETTNPNARNSDAAGSHLRFNNPIGGTLVFSIPTTGYTDIIIKYGTRRSGSGAGLQMIEYTTNGTNYTLFDSIAPVDGNPTTTTLDFSAITAVDNNANFKIRITFKVGGGGTGGNNRIDNFTAEGTGSGPDVTAPLVTFIPADTTIDLDINTKPVIKFNEAIRLINNTAIDNTNVDALVELRLNNSTGAVVAFDATISGNDITITPSANLLNNQVYYVALKANVVEDMSDNAVSTLKSARFTTIIAQTQFQPGDMAFVAYRMNATGTDDEVALVTFIDILPGTKINFTDAKYTDNATAQCPGGFTWTAPLNECIPAGSVITIKNDVPSTNKGTITGSGFGLSSGGDQMMVYTGTNTNPNYITALTSNNWLTANITCNGSNSKKPAPLTDGQTSINASTAPGNASGNTANAYYSGTQSGTAAQLRTAINNPANWVGVGSGTAAQTWPTWNFPGPPSVVSVIVSTQTTIKVIFNRDLDNTSATNTANFTGIAGLTGITQTNNGSLADTLTLTYTTPFPPATVQTVTVTNVKDKDNNIMLCPYVFTFSYDTKLAFDKDFVVVNEDAGNIVVTLKVTNPATASVSLAVKAAPFSTALASDFTYTTQTQNFNGTNGTYTITIPIADDAVAEQDEYFVLALENPVGLTITGNKYMTVYIKDNDRKAPTATKEIELNYVASYEPVSGTSTCEIVVYDSASKRLITTSSIQNRLDISNFANPANIQLIKSIDMAPYGGVTSVATYNGVVAVSSPNVNPQLPGSVVFFNTNGDFQKQVTVGALPDMVCFTPDGKFVLTADEGQPNDAYTVDPEASVSMIDISGGITALTQANVTVIPFTSFNAQEAALLASGVRKLKATSTLSQDFEPEFITVAADSKKAWVTLQENNAIGEIDITSKTITSVWSCGTKDFTAMGNGFDASDNNSNILIANWPIKSYYLADGVANYSVGSDTYLVTANEGDEKEYGGLVERTTVGAVKLDSIKFPNRDVLQQSYNMGRLRITNLKGDTDNDGDYDELYMVGARSFSIFNANTKSIVYDSKDDFETITASDSATASIFNADNEGNGFKGRSRAKGPEPEGVTVAKISGQTFAFVALERVGGVMVYNITNPTTPTFSDYKNSRSKTAYTGDHGPEGIIYITPQASPNGKAYIVVANEISGTVSVFEVKNNLPNSVNDLDANGNTFTVYPNPTNGNVTIEYTLPANGEFEVYDLSGRKLYSQTVQGVANTATINAELSNGIYFYTLTSGGYAIATGKLVVVK